VSRCVLTSLECGVIGFIAEFRGPWSGRGEGGLKAAPHGLLPTGTDRGTTDGRTPMYDAGSESVGGGAPVLRRPQQSAGAASGHPFCSGADRSQRSCAPHAKVCGTAIGEWRGAWAQ
jgi:hypothetical protein